jgi:predicted lipase
LKKEIYSGCKDCEVHLGFQQGYESFKEPLFTEVSELVKKYPNANLVITGHSFGGAMATLAAVDFENSGKKVSLITFGSPRVGNEVFSKYANQKIQGSNYRVSYIDDPVTGVPPASLGFLHTGQEIYYYDFENFSVFPKGFDSKKNFNSFDFNQHSQYENIEINQEVLSPKS